MIKTGPDRNHFKKVNDRYGHKAGDRVLVQTAQRMVESIRAGDTAARLGGDEFVMLLVDLESIEECERTMARVLSALTDLFELEQGISR